MRAREYLETGILAALPGVAVYKPAERLGEADPADRGRVQIIRTKIETSGALKRGEWLETLEVWVLTRLIDPAPADTTEVDLETDLDGLTDDVLDVLAGMAKTGVRFVEAIRAMHPDGPHGYRITVTAKTH